jgi:hypothetical protein
VRRVARGSEARAGAGAARRGAVQVKGVVSSVIPTHVLEGRGARRGSALSRSNSVKRSPSSTGSASGAPGTPAGVLRAVGSSLRDVRSVLRGGASPPPPPLPTVAPTRVPTVHSLPP